MWESTVCVVGGCPLGLTFGRFLEILYSQTSSPPRLVLSYLLPWVVSFPIAGHFVTDAIS